MPQKKPGPRPEWDALETRACAECGHPIPAGDRITWGITGAFAHPPCARDGAAVDRAIAHARRLRRAFAANHPKR